MKHYKSNPDSKARLVTLSTMTIDNKELRDRRKRRFPAWAAAAICVAAVAVLAVTLFVFVFSGDMSAAAPANTPKVTVTPVTTPAVTPTPTPTPTPVPTITPEPTPQTMWGAKFPGKFTDGEVVQGENSYKSANVNVSVEKVNKDGITYYVADIYITDIKYFISSFSSGKYKGGREYVHEMAKDAGAIIAVNGDYYKVNPGPVFKNGELYRNTRLEDVLVMFKDGTMQTYTKKEFDMDAVKGDAWQMWTWGPMLLEDGEPMVKFNLPASIGAANPRTAVGYYEPGHYVFVTVDGRQKGYSKGMKMTELSQLMYDLGCTVAFNLDGGASSQMAFMGENINKPYGNRKDCDALCIIDEPINDTDTEIQTE